MQNELRDVQRKTLKYYRTTIEAMTEAIDKGVRHMQTDDLGHILQNIQEKAWIKSCDD